MIITEATEEGKRKRIEKNYLILKRLWVDMPGEMVKGLNLEIKEGEILGLGGMAGQGK